jgi:hypothetical protein
VENYSAIENTEILLFVTTWMKLEIMMLNKIRQAQKNKHYIISLMWNLKKVVLIEVESRMVATRDLGEGVRRESLISGY